MKEEYTYVHVLIGLWPKSRIVGSFNKEGRKM
jgi:hypothetical protein